MEEPLKMTLEEIVKKAWEQDNDIYRRMKYKDKIAIVACNKVIVVERLKKAKGNTAKMNFEILDAVGVEAILVDEDS